MDLAALALSLLLLGHLSPSSSTNSIGARDCPLIDFVSSEKQTRISSSTPPISFDIAGCETTPSTDASPSLAFVGDGIIADDRRTTGIHPTSVSSDPTAFSLAWPMRPSTGPSATGTSRRSAPRSRTNAGDVPIHPRPMQFRTRTRHRRRLVVTMAFALHLFEHRRVKAQQSTTWTSMLLRLLANSGAFANTPPSSPAPPAPPASASPSPTTSANAP
uniref:Uncharacterized protein n=1 Tax=Mycena chlorophos TaxID=658473 RepID=A0ABQ0LW40_MYCCL|nr:predicted protein [Mycena chlorophos]